MTYVLGRMLDQIKDALPTVRRTFRRWLQGSFLKTMFGNYRPERHYMRGSGPKSRSMTSEQEAGAKQA